MKKILLTFSTTDILGLEKNFLGRANIKIFSARSGMEAIEIFKLELPDLVVLEHGLTDMTGLEVCKDIFSTKRCPVLLVLEKGDDRDLKTCREVGVDDFILKPIDHKEILKKVGTLLNIPQREDFRILMKVRVEGKKEESFFMGSTIDISTSGVLVETHNKEINVGDHLECNFFLPWKLKAVNIKGEVARKVEGKENFQYGIHFLKLDPILRKEIEDYIKKKERIGGQ